MSIFYGYMSNLDRGIAIEAAEFENEYNRLSTLFEMTSLQLKQMERDAKLKVFKESGTYDDLEFLLEEANKEVSENRQNIFQKIIGWFLKIFSSIGEKIKKIFNIKDDDKLVEAPEDTLEKTKAIEKAWNNMSAGAAKLSNGDFRGARDVLKALKLPAILVGSAALGVAGKKIYNKKFKTSELKNAVTSCSKIKDKVQGIINKISSIFKSGGNKIVEQGDDAKESLSPFQKLISFISSHIGNIWSYIMSSKSKSNSNNETNDSEDKNTDNNETTNDNEDKNTANNNNDKDTNNDGQTDINNQDNQSSDNIKTSTYKSGSGKTEVDINSEGKVLAVRVNGVNKDWHKNPLPRDVRHKVDKFAHEIYNVGATFESMSIRDLNDIVNKYFGESATLSILPNGDMKISNIYTDRLIDSNTSIFGHDLSYESEFTESYDDFDEEILGLMNSFKDIF